jgi:hypothetical protein
MQARARDSIQEKAVLCTVKSNVELSRYAFSVRIRVRELRVRVRVRGARGRGTFQVTPLLRDRKMNPSYVIRNTT